MKPEQQTALKKCCQEDQECLNFAEDDIGGLHENPCGDYCDQIPEHDNWTDKDLQCLYKTFTTGKDALEENVANCAVKNISEMYSVRQLYNLSKSGSNGNIPDIINKCSSDTNFDGKYSIATGTPCSGDSDCPDGQECKNEKCQKKGLSVGAWVGIGIAILLILGLVGFIVYRHSSPSHLTRSSI